MLKIELTPHERMMKARTALIMTQAFFGALAMRLRIVERNDIPTTATEGKHLFYNRKFLDKLTPSVILFAIAHEVLHCALGHHTRRGNRDHKLWNIACDHVVNLMLLEAGFDVPSWVFKDSQYRGLSAEQVYKLLKQDQERQQEQEQQEDDLQEDDDDNQSSGGQGDPDDEGDDEDDNDGDEQCDTGNGTPSEKTPSGGDGDGGTSSTSPDGSVGKEAGSSTGTETSEPSESSDGPSTKPGTNNYPPSHGDPGECGEIMDAAPAHDQAALDQAADEWQVYTRQAANIARRQGEGKLPGFLEEVIETLNEPQTDWRATLQRFVDPQTSTKDYSFTQLNRRYLSMGYFTPSLISDGINHAAMVVDSSGSVDSDLLKIFGSEVQGALDIGAIDKITVIFADDGVHQVAEYNKGDIIDFTVQGRGGTNFAPAFAWINENIPDVSVVIYFTDLECSSFGEEPAYPVLWAAYGRDPRVLKEYMDQVPFGECVPLN